MNIADKIAYVHRKGYKVVCDPVRNYGVKITVYGGEKPKVYDGVYDKEGRKAKPDQPEYQYMSYTKKTHNIYSELYASLKNHENRKKVKP